MARMDKNILLREAHDLIAALLLHGTMDYDIVPGIEMVKRIRAFNARLREIGVVDDNP